MRYFNSRGLKIPGNLSLFSHLHTNYTLKVPLMQPPPENMSKYVKDFLVSDKQREKYKYGIYTDLPLNQINLQYITENGEISDEEQLLEHLEPEPIVLHKPEPDLFESFVDHNAKGVPLLLNIFMKFILHRPQK
jgi:hypothetical protein